MKTIYLVRMMRWGDEDGHTYISVATDSYLLSKFRGEYHGKFWRGGKYEASVFSHEVPDDCKTVYIEMSNMKNINGKNKTRFSYAIDTNPHHKITRNIKNFCDDRLTIREMNIEIEKNFDNKKTIKDFLKEADADLKILDFKRFGV